MAGIGGIDGVNVNGVDGFGGIGAIDGIGGLYGLDRGGALDAVDGFDGCARHGRPAVAAAAAVPRELLDPVPWEGCATSSAIWPRAALLRLERASRISPALGNAYREGRLSWVQAHAVVPVLRIDHGRPDSDGWIRWATQVSFRRLQEDVERALLLNEADPEQFAATAGLPIAARGSTADAASVGPDHERSRERQIGAQLRVSAETTRLFIHAPREVASLFRGVLCTVRRAIERQTGRMPTEGEAFEAMLEHTADAWVPPGTRVRAAHRVFTRDGWRCTAPGCSSFRNLHDHHIVFRSAGDSDELGNRTTLCAWHDLRGVRA